MLRLSALIAAVIAATLSASAASARCHNQHPCDRSPPKFAGLTRVCYSSGVFMPPGPQLTFQWSAAQDDRTPRRSIVYEIFGSTTSGGEDFRRAIATSKPGATSYVARFPENVVFFVVRARDRAGNVDHNRVERRIGANGCPPPPP